ncbi:Aste57867_4446 [Aphanomyces stellatus]|uniref:Aste57867_4446 protein n=1 Tax=Aphanomyces stellatus TaxID=120398 RepID=A0A485KGL6_9STRA|nr:hypothetical protein As57867_004434 [Aphanomyces stellatus]VFT81557.1 Aste57867_4446 [Aphanomyces stellatus]
MMPSNLRSVLGQLSPKSTAMRRAIRGDRDASPTAITKLLNAKKVVDAKRYILDSGLSDTDLTTVDQKGLSVLDHAVDTCNLDLVACLLSHTNYKLVPNWNGSPLARAMVNKATDVCALLLTTYGSAIDVHYKDKAGEGLLCLAAKVRAGAVLTALIQHGGDVNQTDKHGATPLFYALEGRSAGAWTIQLLVAGGANLGHENNRGRTALAEALSKGRPEKVLALCHANAPLDGCRRKTNPTTVHDDTPPKRHNDKAIANNAFQLASRDEMRALVVTERQFRARHPLHAMVRNGSLASLQQWLDTTTAIGFGALCVWRIEVVANATTPTVVELRFRLASSPETGELVCLGRYTDASRGDYDVHGRCHDPQGGLFGPFVVTKTYVADGATETFNGRVDDCVWRGNLTSSEGNTSQFTYVVPMRDCSLCKHPNVVLPHARICVGCQRGYHKVRWDDVVITDVATGRTCEDTWHVRLKDALSPWQATYHLSGTLWDCEFADGWWSRADDRITLTLCSTKARKTLTGVVDKATKKWTATDHDGRWVVTASIPTWPCDAGCGADTPRYASLCLTCTRERLSAPWVVQFEDSDATMALNVIVQQDTTMKQYRLVGDGHDVTDGAFVSFGTWCGSHVELTKAFDKSSAHFEGDVDGSQWRGLYTPPSGAPTSPFCVSIPMYACLNCVAPMPVANAYCFDCPVPSSSSSSSWQSHIGRDLRVWRGRRSEDRVEWNDESFTVQVHRDQDMYSLSGFGSDGASAFSTLGSWKRTNEIVLTRIYPTCTATFTGPFDALTKSWSGTLAFDHGSGRPMPAQEFYFKVPVWSCLRCANLVPIEHSICFQCDNQRCTTAPVCVVPNVNAVRRDLFTRGQISRLLNERDEAGKMVLMHAAAHGHADLMQEILPYLSRHDVCKVSHDGHMALDLALAQQLVCTQNTFRRSNEGLLRCIELLRRRSDLPIETTHIPKQFDSAKACGEYCTTTTSSTKVQLLGLAKENNWPEVEDLLKTNQPCDLLNAVDPDTGRTVAHLVCNEGNVQILHLLLDQDAIDLNIHDTGGKFPMYYAMKNDHVDCVQALLNSGVSPTALAIREPGDLQIARLNTTAKCYKILLDKYDLMENPNLKLYYKANVGSVKAAEDHERKQETALHAAILTCQQPSVVRMLAQDELIDVNAQDVNGNTALMVASRGESDLSLAYLDILVFCQVDIDISNANGQTALMIAAMAEQVSIVGVLLQWMAEVDIEDKAGYTCLDQVQQQVSKMSKQGNDESSASPYNQILDLLTMEIQIRASSIEFRKKMAKSLTNMTTDEAFLKRGFRKAINCDVVLARTYLDDCVTIHHHDVEFSHMEKIYGEDVDSCALNSILRLRTSDTEYIHEARKHCLEHPVIHRLLSIKWELFGQRLYVEQSLMNTLLLVTTTISSIVFDEVMAITSGPLLVGVVVVTFVFVGCIVSQFLRPRILWQLARILYDGRFVFDPKIQIPNLANKKVRVKYILFPVSVLLTAVLSCVALYGIAIFHVENYFALTNNLVLWVTVAYFLSTELNEARAGILKYFESNINKAQMTVFLIIFCVFVPMKLGIFSVSESVQTGLGGFITIVLWVLTVQYLEVIPSASYLLPMMSNLLQDVWNFFILFGVFQLGLTITFYQLFRHQDDDAFKSLGQSFITTYFVAFGQLPLDSLKSFEAGTVDGDILSGCAVVLMMFHAAVVVLLLLNVLLALMNKTVDVGIEKARIEALASYGYCILRLEESVYTTKDSTDRLIYFVDGKGIKVLNPIFNERVPKAQLPLSDDQVESITAYANDRVDWTYLMRDIEVAMKSVFNTFRDKVCHVQHFIDTDAAVALEKEFKLIEHTVAKISKHITSAAKSRGQDRPSVLNALIGVIKKEVSTFEDQFSVTWHAKDDQNDEHRKCILVHQMTTSIEMDAILKEFREEIQGQIDVTCNRKVVDDVVESDAHKPTVVDLPRLAGSETVVEGSSQSKATDAIESIEAISGNTAENMPTRDDQVGALAIQIQNMKQQMVAQMTRHSDDISEIKQQLEAMTQIVKTFVDAPNTKQRRFKWKK